MTLAPSAEQQLARFAHRLAFESLPREVVTMVRRLLLSAAATAVAGANEEGIAPLLALARQRGGRAEATVFVHGDRVPAPAAALINGTMCRALDYCDAMAPGIHIGSSLVPAAFAAAQLRDSPVTGRDFIAAVAAGAEIGARMNLTEDMYDHRRRPPASRAGRSAGLPGAQPG